ncbi:MAG: O-antigen ligase family protein [Oscillospiraceae bacterium]|nr:O-antigen ligase family protein [Oscillospiraceae bacterium]
MKKKADNKTPLGELICTVYLCLLGVALPLTVHDAYFDITRTKALVFWLLSGLFLCGWAVVLCIRRGEWPLLPRCDLPGVLFAVFCGTHILSTLLFRPFPAGLAAVDNRLQGVWSFLCYLLVFLILRRRGKLSSLARFALLLGAASAALLGVLDVFDLSILPLRAVSPAEELPRFLSTVGNISFFGALCLLFFPLAAYFALSAKDLRGALPYALCAALLFCGGIAARTEAFLLGALTFFAVLPLLCRDATVLRRTPLLWALAAAAALLFTLAMGRWALYRPSELTRKLCAPTLLLPFLLLAASAFWLLRGKGDGLVAQLRKIYKIVFWALFALGAVFLLLANTLWRSTLPPSIASVAVLSPSWGTDRGAEWASFWQMFLAAPFHKKLIGSGAGSLAAWDAAHRLFPDALTDSAHNEYLHYLLTGGLTGLAAYLVLLGTALRRALQKPSRTRTALALSCTAYAVQAAVNIAQPFTTPLFFALLALQFSDEEGDGPNRDGGQFWYVALCALAAALLVAAAM